MQRILILMFATMLLIVACGGDSGEGAADEGDDQPGATQGETTSPPADDNDAPEETSPSDDDEADPGGDDSEGEGPSSATVTLGDETYNFSSEAGVVAQCLTDLFGIFSIQLAMIDESGAVASGSVGITVLHEDTDPDVVGEVNSVRLDVGDELWIANEADEIITQNDKFEPGMSQVDSVEIEGRSVSGTATFLRQNSLFVDGEPETATGSFEATCGEERTS